jgi:hypothetical protein
MADKHEYRPDMSGRDLDVEAGMDWWNGLSRLERAYWLGVADSAVAADAWKAFKRAGRPTRVPALGQLGR